jgi:uncharacterized protein (TIGR03790 family)
VSNPPAAGFFFAPGNRFNLLFVNIAAVAFALIVALVANKATALNSSQLGLIINVSDSVSVQIGEYYAAKRAMPFQNVIKVNFARGKSTLTHEEFDKLRLAVEDQSSPRIQAYALTWAAPYRVECMSITAAFAFGFDLGLCADGCKPTRASPYFDSRSRSPFSKLGMRPTMALAAASYEQAQELIERGVSADGSFPTGTAYLLRTSDSARNVRVPSYPLMEQLLKGRLEVRRLQQDALFDAKDVLFYFIGKANVFGLKTLGFLPGAVADHLTSSGGQLTDSPQMSALRWLEAGATASYGTVEEPCNLPQKFPHPAVLAKHYLNGDTVIEAYWKSVQMPGQGIFIGEPLAAPFRRTAARR